MKKLGPIVKRAKKDKDILGVMVFGSFARGEARPSSDIDVCLILHPKFSGNFSKKKLEYLSLADDKVDIHVFQQLPSYVRVRVLRDGKLLLSKDYEKLLSIFLRTIKEFELFKKHYYACIKGVAYAR